MKIAVLFSGGKDSTMALWKAMQEGHDIRYLVSAFPSNPESFLFHTSNIELTELCAEAVGIPLVKVEIKSLKDVGEAQELEGALKELDIDGIAVGGVSSNYQGKMFGDIAKTLGLEMYAPYWQKSHESLIREAIGAGFKIVITSVSAEGLTKEWLGKELNEKTLQELKELNEKFGVDIGGEGGEYCTFVKDGPIFKKKIEFLETEQTWEGMARKLIVKRAELREN